MSEIPSTPINAPTNLVPTNQFESSKLVSAGPFNSHVLALNQQTVSLSVPGQAILVLDISDNKQLQQLQAGQSLRVSVELIEQRQLNVTIRKIIPPSEPLAEVPLSRDLANKLTTNTKFPENQPEQLAYIKKNSPVTIGQARRLPHEMIKLVTPDQKNIKAALPSSSRVPLNQTYTLTLVIAKDGAPQVQFSKLQSTQAPIIVSNTVSQLTENSPKTDLTKLLTMASSTLSKTQNVESLNTSNTVSATSQLHEPTIDMSLPKNKLWLRYQPLTQVMTQLAQVTKEVAQLSPKSAIITDVAATPSAQVTQTSPASSVTTPAKIPPQTQPMQTSASATLSKQTAQISSSTSVTQQIPASQQAQTTSSTTPTNMATPQLTTATQAPPAAAASAIPSIATSQQAQTTAATPATPLTTPTITPAPLTTPTITSAPQTTPTITPAPQTTPTITPAPLTTPTITSAPLTTPTVTSAPLTTPTITSAPLTTPTVTSAPLTTPTVTSAPQTTPTVTSAPQTISSMTPEPQLTTVASALRNIPTTPPSQTSSSSSIATEPPAKESLAMSKNNIELQSAGATIKPKKNLGGSLSLQKLNALLVSLKTPPGQTTGPQLKQAPEQSEPSFDAIIKLQSLTKQLQYSLPDMQKLTKAPMLPNLIEQFVRFEPLAPTSISLPSLGSLAGALQLLLGGRSALSTQSHSSKALSPELTAQLKKILQQGKNSSQANLLQSLAQFGNFGALKSLEETLTSLSGHLQLYQYQSQEQSNNNQQVFYFVLPTSESTLPQVEGKIEQQRDPDDPKRTTWQLTLLLPVGTSDKIKASASLQGTSVEIELVSNSEEIVKKAEFYTDFLSQRLVSQGLTKTNISCKQAELPKSLLQRPNQLVELII